MFLNSLFAPVGKRRGNGSPHDLTDGARLLCDLVGVFLNPNDDALSARTQARLTTLSPTARDHFDHLIIHHGLAGLISQRLITLGAPVSPILKDTARRQWAKNQVCLRTLSDVTSLFNTHGLRPPLPLKGLVVLPVAYPDIGARANNDVDILVHPKDFAQAGALLIRAGFRVLHKDPQHPWSQWASYERSYISPTGVIVDLHRGLGYAARVRWDIPTLWQRATCYPALSDWVPTGLNGLSLSPEDTWLHLVAHQAQDAFLGPLRQWVDLALWITVARPDPTETARRAEHMGMGAIFRCSVRVLQQLWTLPPAVLPPCELPSKAWSHLWGLEQWVTPQRIFSHAPARSRKLTLAWVTMASVDSPRQAVLLGLRHVGLRIVDRLWTQTTQKKSKNLRPFLSTSVFRNECHTGAHTPKEKSR